MIFRQLFDPKSCTYTYLLADSATREGVLIDPVFEHARRDEALVRELGVRLSHTLETHIHADHVTAAWLFKSRLGSQIAVSRNAGAEGVDRPLDDSDTVSFGAHELEVRATPGHTDGCITFVLDKGQMAFTGDALLIRGAGRTDFQQGDPRKLYQSVHDRIFSLPESCLIYPAHDYSGRTCTSVMEEKTFNPRLGGELSEDDFAIYMQNLGLPHPKLIDVAVPANMRVGRPEADAPPPDEPDWAPLSYSYAGVWQIDPIWLEEHLDGVELVDVRSREEYDGALGRIPGARLLPLSELEKGAAALDASRPIVAVCRAGGRSAQATSILKRAGFKRVANLPGGMIRWNALGLKTEYAPGIPPSQR